MTLAEIFDVVRHVVELFFYLITGPLVTVFVARQWKRQRRIDQQMIELHRRLADLAAKNPTLPAMSVVVLSDELNAVSLPQQRPERTIAERSEPPPLRN